MASHQAESPAHTQHLLAILQGYSSRINSYRELARSLSTHHDELKKSIEDFKDQIRFNEEELARHADLIECQRHHIRTLEDIRSKDRDRSIVNEVEPRITYSPIEELLQTSYEDMFPD